MTKLEMAKLKVKTDARYKGHEGLYADDYLECVCPSDFGIPDTSIRDDEGFFIGCKISFHARNVGKNNTVINAIALMKEM